MVQEQEALGVGLLLGMKANISNCFLLPANLSLFYCCSSDSGVNSCLGKCVQEFRLGEEYTDIPHVLLVVLVWDLLWSSWMSLPLKCTY